MRPLAQWGLSQPALTQGILKLEKLMGEVLFERRPDGSCPRRPGNWWWTGRGPAWPTWQQAPARWAVYGVRTGSPAQHDPQLRAFVALVRAGISAAAADLGCLSRQCTGPCANSRRRWDASWWSAAPRSARQLCRSAFCPQLQARAGRTQAAFSELGRDPHNPTIALGTTPGTWLPRAEAMALMVAERFPAGFRVHEGSWGELVEALRDGVIDIIVGEIPDDAAPDLATHPLYEEAPVVVAGRQHPLATRRSCTPQMLASCPWIIAPENSPLRAEWERLFADRRPRRRWSAARS